MSLVPFGKGKEIGCWTPVGVTRRGCGRPVVEGDRGFVLDSPGVTVWHHHCYLDAAEITLATDWCMRQPSGSRQARSTEATRRRTYCGVSGAPLIRNL